MRQFINKLTGGEMWVADSRVEEYLAAGHRLAASPAPEKPTKTKPEVEEVAPAEEDDPPVKKYVAKRRKR